MVCIDAGGTVDAAWLLLTDRDSIYSRVTKDPKSNVNESVWKIRFLKESSTGIGWRTWQRCVSPKGREKHDPKRSLDHIHKVLESTSCT